MQKITFSHRIAVMVMLFFSIIPSCASKAVTITGEYLYVIPKNVTREQAEQTALIRARVKGLADKFGMVVGQDVTTVLSNINGESSASVYQQTMSSVKGEWLKDVEEPKYDIGCESGEFFVSVKVKFKAREKKIVKVDFDCRVLRNCTSDDCESDDFINGNHIYLSFKAPKDGYLAVYLVEGEVAQCLLPYGKQTEGIYQVKANKRYVFFSKEEDESPFVNYLKMNTDKDIENDVLYVIYSPNEFTKAVDEQSDRNLDGKYKLPRELPFRKFQEWLSDLKLYDDHLNDKSKIITIRR